MLSFFSYIVLQILTVARWLFSTQHTVLSGFISSPPFPAVNIRYLTRTKNMVNLLPLVILIGLLLSSYALYVEHRMNEAKRFGSTYTAYCDFGRFSCTKVFSSEWGYASQFFGLPKISNAVMGICLYMFEIILELVLRWNTGLLVVSGCSCVGSVGLFYLLSVVLNDFCIVCISIYVVNFTTFFIALSRYRKQKQKKQKLI